MKRPCDDREQPCGIAQLSGRQIGWRALGLKSVTPDPIIKREQGETAVRETVIALGGGVVGWVFWQMLISPITKPLVGDLLDLLFIMIFSIVVAMVFWYVFLGWIRRGRFVRIAEIYLSQGHCASCGYKLDGLDIEPDGCVVCPECNAAWQHERISTKDTDEES
jgi:hypothetical protein